MARPRKKPQDQRSRVLSVRLTAAEYDRVTAMARDAGMLAGPYARITLLDKRPRSKPVTSLVFQKLLYELQSVATNLSQLADATGDDRYLHAARHVAGHLVEQLIGRDDLVDEQEVILDPLNAIGHSINGLAHKANAGGEVTADDRAFALRQLKLVLEPLGKALEEKG